MKFIDLFLDRITMYRVVLYYLIVLLAVAAVFGFFGIIKINPIILVFSTAFLIAVSWITNQVFARTFNAPTNIESVYITALILALIINPIKSPHDLAFIFWVAVLSMASKYILAIGRIHIFNPAAIAVVIVALGINAPVSWWIGTPAMLPFVLIGGLLVVKKIRKKDLMLSFFATAIATFSIFDFISGSNILISFQRIIFDSAIFFFAFVMLTEPITTPPTKNLQIIYGTLVGFLFALQVHIGNFYPTPEIALCIGNIFSFIVSPKYKLMLKLKDKIQYGTDIINFNFLLDKKIVFVPGQYMEWTIPHNSPDSRGNRRYFTIASSPTEDNLKLGVKFYQNGSSFKNKMAALDGSAPIVGTGLAGEFTLPRDKDQKCVFIAGGIGITPYRSMFKYLIDTKQKRPIILFYSNKKESEIAYKDIFDQAEKELAIKTVYVLTEQDYIPANWTGKRGRMNPQMIAEEVPDYMERIFYLSGPHTMIEGFEKVLKEMGVKNKNIKKDLFPGLV